MSTPRQINAEELMIYSLRKSTLQLATPDGDLKKRSESKLMHLLEGDADDNFFK